MSVRAYEAMVPLHEYDLRAGAGGAALSLYCLKCGLALTAWLNAHPPGLDVVIRTARDHELSAHPRPRASLIHRPGGER